VGERESKKTDAISARCKSELYRNQRSIVESNEIAFAEGSAPTYLTCPAVSQPPKRKKKSCD